MRDVLGLPADHAIAGLIALGHPAKVVRKLTRHAVEQFTTIDRFDGPVFQPR